MLNITYLTPNAAVSAALTEADFAEVASRGFKSVVNFRPDAEAIDQVSSQQAMYAATAAGLTYAHIPVPKYELFANEIVSEAACVLANAAGPILAYCASGQRAAIVWAAANARSTPVKDILDILTAAGFDLDFLRDDLEAQADRARWAESSSVQGAVLQPQSEPRAAA